MKAFNIGDRVRVKDYYDIPEKYRTKGLARLCGEIGVIADKLYSESNDCFVYSIKFDSFDVVSKKMWCAETLVEVNENVEYTYEFEYLENLVVARLYEIKDNQKTEIAKGHGHIFHEGVLGIAQAASYALKKLYQKLGGEIDG